LIFFRNSGTHPDTAGRLGEGLGNFNSERKAEFGFVYTFIGTHVLKGDHGAKRAEEAPFVERFQRSGPSASKPSGLISQSGV
jgi:hypothetical protein